jgi:hypothetical protein
MISYIFWLGFLEEISYEYLSYVIANEKDYMICNHSIFAIYFPILYTIYT